MKTCLDCIPCIFKQMLRAGRIVGLDDDKIKCLLDETADLIPALKMTSTPPEVGRIIYGRLRQLTGNDDPYREIKTQSTRQALKLYPYLKETVASSPDPLLSAIRVAIAGNVIDFGVYDKIDLESSLERVLEQPFAVCDYETFVARLKRAERVIYIGDNAGETVFDRVLIEEIDKPTTYVVREQPVINDAVYDDAVHAGLDKVADIISSGTTAPGTVLDTCSDHFLEMLGEAEFIIAKGQGNYEALSAAPYPIFFMLMAKCPVIAEHMGVKQDDIVLKTIN